MSFWESLNQTLNSDLSFNIATAIITIFVFVGMFTYADIQIKDRVWIIKLYPKDKEFNMTKLIELFNVQAILLTGIGIIVFFLLLAFTRLMLVYYFILLVYILFQIGFTITILRKTARQQRKHTD